MPSCHDTAHLGKPIAFEERLWRVRIRKFPPPLYFAPTIAGPDVVFIPKSNYSEDLGLCAIQASTPDHGWERFRCSDSQLKTAVCYSKDNAIAVLQTIEPNL